MHAKETSQLILQFRETLIKVGSFFAVIISKKCRHTDWHIHWMGRVRTSKVFASLACFSAVWSVCMHTWALSNRGMSKSTCWRCMSWYLCARWHRYATVAPFILCSKQSAVALWWLPNEAFKYKVLWRHECTSRASIEFFATIRILCPNVLLWNVVEMIWILERRSLKLYGRSKYPYSRLSRKLRKRSFLKPVIAYSFVLWKTLRTLQKKVAISPAQIAVASCSGAAKRNSFP